MQKKITLGKLLLVALLLILSFLVLNFNETLRVPSIFDGKFYTTALLKQSDKPYNLPEKQVVLPDLSIWLDSTAAAKYQYPDFFLQNTSTTSFLVLRNDTVIFKRYLNGIKEGDNTQLFSVTKVFVTALLGMAVQDNYIKDVEIPCNKLFYRFARQAISTAYTSPSDANGIRIKL
jgi:hypothetical protein